MLVIAVAVMCTAGVVGVAFVGDEVDNDHETLEAAGSSYPDDTREFDEGFDEEFDEDSGSASDETSDSVEVGPESATDAPTQSSPNTGGSAASGTNPSAGPASADPGQPAPPALGRYTFDVSEDGEDDVATLKVERPPGGPNDTRVQTVDDYQDDRRLFSWRTDGVYWLELGDPANPNYTCRWNPAILLLKLPIRVGSSWTFDSRCTVSDPDFGDAAFHVSGTIKVSGTERVIVGGEPVDTYVVQADVVTELTFTIDGEVLSSTSEIQEISNFAPRVGLDVKSVETSEESSDGEVEHSRLERRLRSLRPT